MEKGAVIKVPDLLVKLGQSSGTSNPHSGLRINMQTIVRGGSTIRIVESRASLEERLGQAHDPGTTRSILGTSGEIKVFVSKAFVPGTKFGGPHDGSQRRGQTLIRRST